MRVIISVSAGSTEIMGLANGKKTAIGEMPETEEERNSFIGYNPSAWYADKGLRTKYDFSAPIVNPVTNLYPKYMGYSKVMFALVTEANAEPDPRLIERDGRVYNGEKIEDVTCGIPTEDDFAALLIATGFIRYWLFDKWVKAAEQDGTYVPTDEVVTAETVVNGSFTVIAVFQYRLCYTCQLNNTALCT